MKRTQPLRLNVSPLSLLHGLFDTFSDSPTSVQSSLVCRLALRHLSLPISASGRDVIQVLSQVQCLTDGGGQ